MAEFTDRIKLVYDVVTEGATSSLSTVKGNVSQAEGAFGKMKASAGGAFDIIKDNAAAAATGAATAIGAFAVKAIGHFEDLAQSAHTFSTAAGVGVEDAARWLEVADDLGVSSDDVSKAMGRLNREADTGALAKFGITADNANDRLIQTLQYISSIPDEAQRATVQFQLLGKGGAALAPLIGHVGELRDRLGEVSGGKIITDEQVAQADKLRDATDALSDEWDSFMLTVGASLAPIVTAIAEITEKVLTLGRAAGDQSAPAWEQLAGNLVVSTGAFKLLGGAMDLVGLSLDSHGSKQAAVQTPITETAHALDTEREAADAANKALGDLSNATVAQFNSQLRYADSFGKTTDKVNVYLAAEAAATEAKGGSAEANTKATDAANDAAQAALAQAAAAVKVGQDQATAAGGTLSNAAANDILIQNLQQVANTLAPGNPLRQQLEGYISQLDSVPSAVHTDVVVNDAAAVAKLQNLLRLVQQLGNAMVGNPFLVSGSGAGPTAAAAAPSGPTGPTPAGLAATPMAAPLPTASAAGAGAVIYSPTVVNYQLTVQAGAVVGSEAELGRVVADALTAHERRVGSRRRLVSVT